MVAHEEIENLYDIVYGLLTADKRYRDNDAMLVAKVWSIQVGGIEKLKHYTAYEFLTEYVKVNTYLVSHESITRARRKVQENEPLLRGLKWKKRHEQQDSVKQVINNL